MIVFFQQKSKLRANSTGYGVISLERMLADILDGVTLEPTVP